MGFSITGSLPAVTQDAATVASTAATASTGSLSSTQAQALVQAADDLASNAEAYKQFLGANPDYANVDPQIEQAMASAGASLQTLEQNGSLTPQEQQEISSDYSTISQDATPPHGVSIGTEIAPSYPQPTTTGPDNLPADGTASYNVSINGQSIPVNVTPLGGNTYNYSLNVGGGPENIKVLIPSPPPDGAPTAKTLASVFASMKQQPLQLASERTIVLSNGDLPGTPPGGASGSAWMQTTSSAIAIASTADGNNPTDPAGFARLTSVLTHETGHVLDSDTGATNDPAWAQACKDDPVTPSTYGDENTKESFAETWALYQAVRGTPEEATYRAMMPERFAYLDKMAEKQAGLPLQSPS